MDAGRPWGEDAAAGERIREAGGHDLAEEVRIAELVGAQVRAALDGVVEDAEAAAQRGAGAAAKRHKGEAEAGIDALERRVGGEGVADRGEAGAVREVENGVEFVVLLSLHT